MGRLLRTTNWIVKYLPQLFVAGLVIGAVLVFFYFKAPGNLGPKLTYIGQDHYGCIYPFPCDSTFGITYYFGSDLTAEGVEEYFGGAVCKPGYGVLNADYKGSGMDCELKNSKKHFSYIYYDRAEKVENIKKLKKTEQKLVIEINKHDYTTARSAIN